MSLALKLPGFSLPTWASLLPRIPAFKSPFPVLDKRLQELKEQIENNHGNAPFMIDNGMILRAAPKKKMSKRRHRTKLYTPGDKQIHQLQNIVRCPACGHVKRSHFMCMHCFAEIRNFLKAKKRENGIIKDEVNPQQNLDPIDERIIYPGKFVTDTEIRMKKKEWIPRREEPLMYDKSQLRNKK